MGRALPHGLAGPFSLRRADIRRLRPVPSYLYTYRAAVEKEEVNTCSQQLRALHGTSFLHGGGSKDDDGSFTTDNTTTTIRGTTTKISTEHRSSGDGGDGGGGGYGIFGSLPTRTALGRVGRGVLVAIPIAGAGFSAVLARRDYRRARQELKLARVRLAIAQRNHQRGVSKVAAGKNKREDGAADDPASDRPQMPTLDTSTAACFGVALAADSGVVAAHLVAAYGLYQGWAPDPVVNAEIASLVGAVVSTGGGVRGEYLVATRRAAEEAVEHGSGESSGT